MGAETIETLTLPLDQDDARALVLAAIGDMKKYDLVDQDASLGLVRWRKGFGWTNPVTIEARFQPGAGGTEVQLKASVMALFDPFGFTREAMTIATGRVQAHLAARQGGGQVPAAPVERRGMIVNVVLIGFVFLFFACACSGIFIGALVGG